MAAFCLSMHIGIIINIVMRPSQWVEKRLYIEGKPFRFGSEYGPRNHLPFIYDKKSPYVLLKTARGCEKSTTICNKIVFLSATNIGYKTLYVNPSPQQITDFVVQQLAPRLKSPWVRENLIDRSCIDNIMLKTLSNDSLIFLRHVLLSPDRARGIRAYLLAVDEVQDMIFKNIPVLEETLFSSHNVDKMRLFAGTPKTFDNTIQVLWDKSSQNMWHVPCSCGYLDNTMDSVKNIGKNGPICSKCGKDILPYNGFWVRHRSDSMIDGFHFNQIMLPWSYGTKEAWEQIIFKLETYGASEFHNEVLGVSFDSADKPITEKEIRACCTGPWYDAPDQRLFRAPLFMGIDWGTGTSSKTVAVICGFIDGKFRVVHFKEFPGYMYPSQDAILDDIVKMVRDWNVIRVAADWGFGFQNNERLRSWLGDDVLFEFYNSANLKNEVKWSATEGKYTINYVVTLTTLFNDIKDEKIEFPNGPKIDSYIRHFMNVHKEYSNSTRKMLYANGPDKPDDYCHATNYAVIMGKIYHGIINPAVGS